MNPLPAAIAIAILALLYAALCAVSPFARCPLCKGTGTRDRDRDKPRLHPRPCRWCRGRRLRLRLGRRVFAYFLALHRNAPSAPRKD